MLMIQADSVPITDFQDVREFERKKLGLAK